MKPIFYALLLLASTVIIAASSTRKGGEKDPIPEQGFADPVALGNWSESSSFGGGMTQKLTLGGQDIYWTVRMVTSGVATTELVLWKQVKGRLVPC